MESNCIKTEEQTPEIGQWVLGATGDWQKPWEVVKYLGMRTGKGWSTRQGDYTYEYQEWTSGHGDIFHGPIAWQPLPEPYKAESEE